MASLPRLPVHEAVSDRRSGTSRGLLAGTGKSRSGQEGKAGDRLSGGPTFLGGYGWLIDKLGSHCFQHIRAFLFALAQVCISRLDNLIFNVGFSTVEFCQTSCIVFSIFWAAHLSRD